MGRTSQSRGPGQAEGSYHHQLLGGHGFPTQHRDTNKHSKLYSCHRPLRAAPPHSSSSSSSSHRSSRHSSRSHRCSRHSSSSHSKCLLVAQQLLQAPLTAPPLQPCPSSSSSSLGWSPTWLMLQVHCSSSSSSSTLDQMMTSIPLLWQQFPPQQHRKGWDNSSSSSSSSLL